jgi:hypothetical protein
LLFAAVDDDPPAAPERFVILGPGAGHPRLADAETAQQERHRPERGHHGDVGGAALAAMRGVGMQADQVIDGPLAL